MKKPLQSNQDNECNQTHKRNLDLEREVAKPLVPEHRSVRFIQAVSLEQVQDNEGFLSKGSDTMLSQVQTNQAPDAVQLSQFETRVHVELTIKSEPSSQNSIDGTILHNPKNIISSPVQINVHAQWSDLIGSQPGDCRVERSLGQGGMGVVFKG